jgi:hypothetical protein
MLQSSWESVATVTAKTAHPLHSWSGQQLTPERQKTEVALRR